EAFLDCTLPISWKLGNDFSVTTRMDFTAGWLGRGGESAAIASVGPALVLKYKTLPLSLEGGSSSTLISEHDFGGANLGGPYQFTTHAGLTWDFLPRWRVGYRFEHISNAGISKPNPGLNLHTFGLAYVF